MADSQIATGAPLPRLLPTAKLNLQLSYTLFGVDMLFVPRNRNKYVKGNLTQPHARRKICAAMLFYPQKPDNFFGNCEANILHLENETTPNE
jgi:hypothetical protein